MAAVLFAVLGLYTTYLFLARFDVRYPLLWIAAAGRLRPDLPLAPVDGADAVAVGAVDRRWASGCCSRSLADGCAGCVVVGFLTAWLFNGFFFVLGAPGAAVLVACRGPPGRDGALGSVSASTSPARGPWRPAEGPRGPRSGVQWTPWEGEAVGRGPLAQQLVAARDPMLTALGLDARRASASGC